MESLLKSTEALSGLVDVFCSALVSSTLRFPVEIAHHFSQIQNIHICDRRQSRNEVRVAPQASWSSCSRELTKLGDLAVVP